MFLTDDENQILDSKQGEVPQKCKKILVDYGEATGAEKLVDRDGTVDWYPDSGWPGAYDIKQEEIAGLARTSKGYLRSGTDTLVQG